MKKTHLIVIFVALILIILQTLNMTSTTGRLTEAKSNAADLRIVTRIVDGDTIVVEGGDRIRLLDIDTPEKGQTCYKEAKDRLTELIDGKQVELKSGKEDKDTYDRLLRYVFYNGTNINMLMVREGWANLYFYNKDTPYYSQLIEAEQAAKIDGLCVWR